MAVSSCKMRKEVMCERGALARADVYLWRNLGRRRLKRSMRDAEDGGGVGWVANWRRVRVREDVDRRCCVARRMVRCIMVARMRQRYVPVCEWPENSMVGLWTESCLTQLKHDVGV